MTHVVNLRQFYDARHKTQVIFGEIAGVEIARSRTSGYNLTNFAKLAGSWLKKNEIRFAEVRQLKPAANSERDCAAVDSSDSNKSRPCGRSRIAYKVKRHWELKVSPGGTAWRLQNGSFGRRACMD